MAPDPEVGLGYDEPVALEDESDDGDYSDYESLDFEDEDDSDFSSGVRKIPPKRTSRVGTRHVDDTEAVNQMLFAATAEASMHDFMSGGASTSAGSSGLNISGHHGLAAPTEFYCADSDVVPDSDPEEDLLEPIVQMGRTSPAKGKRRNKSHRKAEYDADEIQDAYSARREALRRTRLEKQEIRMLEYQFGRRLTYVGSNGHFLFLDLFLLFFLPDSDRRKNLQFSYTSTTLSFAMPGVTSMQLSKRWSPKRRSSHRGLE
jgi:hypothetical protein